VLTLLYPGFFELLLSAGHNSRLANVKNLKFGLEVPLIIEVKNHPHKIATITKCKNLKKSCKNILYYFEELIF